MFERYTDRARRVVVIAQEECRELGGSDITSAHLLAGMLREGEGVAALTLAGLGVELEWVREQIPTGEKAQGHIPFTGETKKVLEYALRAALRLGHNYIGTEHLLLGVVAAEDGCAAGKILCEKVPFAVIEEAVIKRLSDYEPPAPPEFDLIALTSTKRGLVTRRSASDAWRQIAAFDSYNDAEYILRLIRRAVEPDPAVTTFTVSAVTA